MSALRFPNPLSFLRILWIRLLPPQSPTPLEERLAKLESEVAQLKSMQPASTGKWWEDIAGSFENDPLFDQAMALGAEYRRAPEQFQDSAES